MDMCGNNIQRNIKRRERCRLKVIDDDLIKSGILATFFIINNQKKMHYDSLDKI